MVNNEIVKLNGICDKINQIKGLTSQAETKNREYMLFNNEASEKEKYDSIRSSLDQIHKNFTEDIIPSLSNKLNA